MSKDKPNMCGVCGRIFGWDDSCNCPTPKPIESLDEWLDQLIGAVQIDVSENRKTDVSDNYDFTYKRKAEVKAFVETLITERERAAYKKGRDDERSCPAHTSLSTQEGDK
jgi:hypothetical protein